MAHRIDKGQPESLLLSETIEPLATRMRDLFGEQNIRHAQIVCVACATHTTCLSAFILHSGTDVNGSNANYFSCSEQRTLKATEDFYRSDTLGLIPV
ncbi:hypothetical protein WG66_010421 [Moniliophthora roreri]|nr:hypothetical protein WG66_010421 [Moniliophthora roreri]